MTTSEATPWQYPQRTSRAFHAADQYARRHGLRLKWATSEDCQARRGRFWLNDPNGRKAIARCDTVREVFGLVDQLAHSRQATVVERFDTTPPTVPLAGASQFSGDDVLETDQSAFFLRPQNKKSTP